MSIYPDVDISRDKRGYYVLTIAGEFEGNFDTIHEATQEAEKILNGGTL